MREVGGEMRALRAPTMTAATPGRASIAALATVAMSRAVPVGDGSRSVRSSVLEQIPAAEIVDDQLVLGQRAVLERRIAARAAPSQRSPRKPPATVP